ncbi:MAG: serine hydrolase [Oscillospiraceae bacterium]
MKRLIIPICIAILLSGCSSAGSQTNIPANMTVVESSQTKSGTKNDNSSQSTAKSKETAQTKNKGESINISDDHSFTYSDFKLVDSNEKLNECFKRLDEICSGADYNLSFSYQNLDTGAQINYRPDSYYLTCSTVKATYVKHLLERNIDLNDIIYKSDVCDGDYGTVASSSKSSFTAKELMEYAILESDNTAYYLLVKNYGYTEFNDMLSRIGASFRLSEGVIWTRCTSLDMMKCFEDIYNYAEENANGKWLVNLMSDADLNIQIGAALGDKYKVAQKYGSEFTEYSFHDCALVYADSPFVLSIFTNQYPETEESCKVFKDLAAVFDEINSQIVLNKS